MCDFEKGFVLCTCKDEPQNEIQHNKRSRRNKHKTKPKSIEYEWTLYEFIEEIVPTEMGRYIMPAFNIGKGLTSEWVLLNLNEGECFDFDYTPKEGDNFIFRQKGGIGKYLSFIYENGKWTEGVHDYFSTIIKENSTGKVKAS